MSVYYSTLAKELEKKRLGLFCDIVNLTIYILLTALIIAFPCMGWISWQTFWFVFFVRWTINIDRLFAKKNDEKEKNDAKRI